MKITKEIKLERMSRIRMILNGVCKRDYCCSGRGECKNLILTGTPKCKEGYTSINNSYHTIKEILGGNKPNREKKVRLYGARDLVK